MDRRQCLTGIWHGLYSYPAALEPVYFVATLLDAGSSLHGSTHEAAIGRTGAPLTVMASLVGGREGGTVHFLKTYDGTGDWRHAVAYAGALSARGAEIEGQWSIPGDWSGRFLMMRSAGATEAAVRKVFEQA